MVSGMSPLAARDDARPQHSGRGTAMTDQVVVTGANGWIGGHVGRVLHRLGWDVVGVSRTPGPASETHPRWRWIGVDDELERAVAEAGRQRSDVDVVVAVDLDPDTPPESQPALADLGATADEWHERGADELVLHWIRPHALPAVLHAAERAGLPG